MGPLKERSKEDKQKNKTTAITTKHQLILFNIKCHVKDTTGKEKYPGSHDKITTRTKNKMRVRSLGKKYSTHLPQKKTSFCSKEFLGQKPLGWISLASFGNFLSTLSLSIAQVFVGTFFI